MNNLRVALVHDFLVQRGGAERVLKVLSEMYPDAPIYTLLYDEEKMRSMFDAKRVKVSYLQKFPKFLRKRYHWLMPFFMVMPEIFDLRDYDLVISSSGAWTKGIVTKLNTTHICYVHSPMRFVWDYNDRYLKEIGKKKISIFVRFVLNYVRIWDRLAADRPDYLIANSEYTRRRINKYYRRDSEVIYPPVVNLQQTTDNKQQATNNQELTTNKGQQAVAGGELPASTRKDDCSSTLGGSVAGYFLVVSRLSPYKKTDIVVEAFNKLGLPLVVIGEGQQKKHLKRIANENIKILGWQDDETVEKYYANARAFIFPAEDDFGITAVEAMAHGVPVIAYRKGGACETVVEGVTGEFFDAQTSDVLADGVRRLMLNEKNYDREIIKKRAAEFSEERFKTEFKEYLDKIV